MVVKLTTKQRRALEQLVARAADAPVIRRAQVVLWSAEGVAGAEIARRDLPARVIAGGCNGMCWAAPVVTVLRGDETPRVIPRVTADRAPALLDALSAGAPPAHADVTAFLTGQRRELMSRCGITDPGDIADAVQRGSYEALRRALGEAQPIPGADGAMSPKLRNQYQVEAKA